MELTSLRPVTKLSAEAQVTDQLREFILSGELGLSTRLTEIALAERLGVARATLRTGLHRLASEGIVEHVPYTGWHVVQLSAQDVWEIWTLRGSLESLAARLAAQNPSPKVRTAIDDACLALLDACTHTDMDRISACDFTLHRAVIDGAGHVRLERQYRLIEQQVRLFIRTSNTQVAEGPTDVANQHRGLIDALRAGDPERAGREAWLHNELEGERLMRWLQHGAGTTGRVS